MPLLCTSDTSLKLQLILQFRESPSMKIPMKPPSHIFHPFFSPSPIFPTNPFIVPPLPFSIGFYLVAAAITARSNPCPEPNQTIPHINIKGKSGKVK